VNGYGVFELDKAKWIKTDLLIILLKLFLAYQLVTNNSPESAFFPPQTNYLTQKIKQYRLQNLIYC